MDNSRSTTVELGSVVNALDVLQAFGPELPSATIADIARAAQLTRPTARRVLLTLVSQGFAQTDGKVFWLTPRVLRLGYGYLSSQPLGEILTPKLRKLAEVLGESCSLAVLDGQEIVYLARVALQRSNITLNIGSRLPAHVTSLGKVLVAFSDSQRRDEYLEHAPFERLTEHTVFEREPLAEQFAAIRSAGYAINDGEREIGVRSVAAPIMGARGVVAAVNISANSLRVSLEEMKQRFVPELLESTQEMSATVKQLML